MVNWQVKMCVPVIRDLREALNLGTAEENPEEDLEITRYQQHYKIEALTAQLATAEVVAKNAMSHRDLLLQEVENLKEARKKDIWDKLRELGIEPEKVNLKDWVESAGIDLAELETQLNEDKNIGGKHE